MKLDIHQVKEDVKEAFAKGIDWKSGFYDPRWYFGKEIELCEDMNYVVNSYLTEERISFGIGLYPVPMYDSGRDLISTPSPRLYRSSSCYYHDLFHEIAHSTGSMTRLRRKGIIYKINKEIHAFEELIAELSSIQLLELFDFSKIEYFNSVNYMASWSWHLPENSILWAYDESLRVVDYLKRYWGDYIY